MPDPPLPDSRYDRELLHDFWRQLTLEVQIAHYENTAPVGSIHSELMESLRTLMERRGLACLLFRHMLQAEDESLLPLATRQFRKERAGAMSQYLAALELLEPLLLEVLTCLKAAEGHPRGVMPTRLLSAEAILRAADHEERSPDDLEGTEGAD